MPSMPQILVCQCRSAGLVPFEVQAAVAKALAASGCAYETVADLCELAGQRDPQLKAFAERGPVKIAACYPRAVKWLFAAAGAALDPSRVEIVNLRVQSAQEVIASLLPANAPIINRQSPAPKTPTFPPSNASTSPRPPSWFPVIDFDRCTNCLQCLGFCLFGVYGVDERRRITVQAPENCKTNCPACSRVCPDAAIMFPKYKTGPIAGDTAGRAELPREALKVDISALLGGDVYQRLRERNGQSRPRFSKERDPETALAERRLCLAKLAALGEIPPEVLMNLPAPEEIQRRAQEAKAKAKELRNAV
jgi:NAD-dependent dihydropyrimidine dehydrogenase PreA subunit